MRLGECDMLVSAIYFAASFCLRVSFSAVPVSSLCGVRLASRLATRVCTCVCIYV